MASRWDKKEAQARYILGLLLSDFNQNECAVGLFGEALRRDPSLTAAYVGMGIAFGEMEAYDKMLTFFGEAVRRDHLSTRVAVVKVPEEVRVITRVLYPPQEMLPSDRSAPALPPEIVEAGDLITLAFERLVEGDDAAAVEALERSLRVDPSSQYAVVRLALAYLLLRARAGVTNVLTGSSVLWEIDPALAQLLFTR
jgi:tetratricopeptide (TPR) repeat protein